MYQFMKNIQFCLYIFYLLFKNRQDIFKKNYDNLAKNICFKIAEINVVYVKLLQIIAVQNVFSSHVNEFLLTYTDDVSYNDDEIDLSFMELFPKDNISDFKLIKSGTMSLIYKFNTPSPIIVKVLRKNIKQKIENSVSNINFLIYLFWWHPFIRNKNLLTIFNENKNKLYEHIDFIQEKNNTITMYEQFKNIDYIITPRVWEQYCNEKCITMDYIEGESITDIDDEDMEEFSNLLIKYSVKGLLYDRIFHGDIHSGNILFMLDENDDENKYKLGIIDFGIMGSFSKEEQNNFYLMFQAVNDNDIDKITDKVIPFLEPQETLKKLDVQDSALLINHLKNITSHIFASNFQFGVKEICMFNDSLKKYNLHLSKKICQPMISMFGLKTMCEYLSKESFIIKLKNYTKSLQEQYMY
jgi:predicted unusual protein kinase regulating ubiquinone biosynthesis (AarF/ABC1/UbiB family)